MSTQSAASHATTFVDPDPTGRDPNPWHEQSGTYDVDEETVIRPVPHLVATCALAPVAWPRGTSEVVEALSLPPGLDESALPQGVRPSGPQQLRVAMVRMAREVGRRYREVHGRLLRTDVASIEQMQRHLLGHAREVLAGRMDPRTLAPEIVSHGVLLGEILARSLGAVWVQLDGDHPGTWQMMVPPATQVCPVARVHRFLLQRNKEQDLVGFFLELAAR